MIHRFSTAAAKSSVLTALSTRNVTVEISRWLTRTNEQHDLYLCGLGFTILTVRASHSWRANRGKPIVASQSWQTIGAPLLRLVTRTYE
ncbi:MAG: hypothetical protein IH937_06215 [Acidobacteria bacterium]|nr:hypothetical protein [Acidobacteriota bacterium]